MSIEAMKQALEALDAGPNAYLLMNTGGIANNLRQAIAEAENQYAAKAAELAHLSDRIQIDPKTGNVSIGSKEAIAEAEKQEPYGYLKLSNAKFYQEVEGVPNIEQSPDYLPLYTHPPKREWVGLTPEDAIDIIWACRGTESIVRTTEAKLKQKNGYSEEKNT